MAPGLGLAHTDPTSYHSSKPVNSESNGVKVTKDDLPAVPVLSKTASVEEVVQALKVWRTFKKVFAGTNRVLC